MTGDFFYLMFEDCMCIRRSSDGDRKVVFTRTKPYPIMASVLPVI